MHDSNAVREWLPEKVTPSITDDSLEHTKSVQPQVTLPLLLVSFQKTSTELELNCD